MPKKDTTANRVAPGFYLYIASTSPTLSSRNVFYWVASEQTGKTLCQLFSREYSPEAGEPVFLSKSAAELEPSEAILLDEALQWLEFYGAEPDRGVYDPEPSTDMMMRAGYAMRARDWERLIVERTGSGGNGSDKAGTNQTPNREAPEVSAKEFQMPAEDRRNSGLNLLFLLAQAYYKILECVIPTASLCCALDLELNESYLWTITSIENLLANHEDLRDFPSKFEPVFPDLYPSTIVDHDWEDMVAPDVEQFLSTVRRYVRSKGIYPPEKESPGWTFVELFRSEFKNANRRAFAYNERMQEYARNRLGEGKLAGATDELLASQEKESQSRLHQPLTPSPTAAVEKLDRRELMAHLGAGRSGLNYHSEIKRAILVQLTKQPGASDAEICRGLDADGAAELPEGWRNKRSDRLFIDAYSTSHIRHKIETAISKVRKDRRKLGLMP